MQCEDDAVESLDNDDDTLYIIVTIILIVLTLVLICFLHNYFSKLFTKIFNKDKVYPLCNEEKDYLMNMAENDKKRKR